MQGERGYGDGSIPCAWLSISHHSLLPHITSFISPQQPLPWDCSTIPKRQLPAIAPSRGLGSLPTVCMAAAQTVWFSFYLGCHGSTISHSALHVSPLTQTIALLWGLDPCFSSPTHQGQVQSYQHSCFSPQFLHPMEFCVVLYILFCWSGPPVCSQLLFCMHFCVWRCIPDVSKERDVLHIHLLIHHLVPPKSDFFKNSCNYYTQNPNCNFPFLSE